MIEIIIKKDIGLDALPNELKRCKGIVEKKLKYRITAPIHYISLGNLLINDEKPELLDSTNQFLKETDSLLFVMRGDLDKPSSFPNVIGNVILVTDVAVLTSGTVLISPGTSVHGYSKPAKLDGSSINKLVDLIASKIIINIDYVGSVNKVANQYTDQFAKIPELNILSMELDYTDAVVSVLELNAGFTLDGMQIFTFAPTSFKTSYSQSNKTAINPLRGGEYFIT